MFQALFAAAVLGLGTGLAPGPFVAFVAATTLEHGRRAGLKVALAPLLVEPPVLVTTLLVLSQLPLHAFRWVGIVGGAAMITLGVSVLRRARFFHEGDHGRAKEGTRNMLKLAGAGLLSPAPWVFWTALGGPLVLRYWHQSVARGAVFLLTFLAFFVGSQLLVALGASHGARLLKGPWYRRARHAMGAVLVVAGLVLAWQAWTGNFHKLIATQQHLEQIVR
jgi:threonine/homoserine/homoserine lactone efflux protein